MSEAPERDALVEELEQAAGVRVRSGVSAAAFTTFAIGGPFFRLVEVDSLPQLQAVVRFFRKRAEPFRVLGGGSNLLIPDEGVKEWVVRLSRSFRYARQLSEGVFEVGARMGLMMLSRDLGNAGFAGLEFAAGIPASVGGAVISNAGAHGGQMADVIQGVQVVTGEGELALLRNADISFSYRRSTLPPGSIVAAVRLALEPGAPDQSRTLRAKWLAERKRTQPLNLPSAGSVFKNPGPELRAGKLLEDAGMKGRRIGGAVVSELHANWIVNPERRATCSDVRALMALCQERVAAEFDVQLEPELVLW